MVLQFLYDFDVKLKKKKKIQKFAGFFFLTTKYLIGYHVMWAV